MWRSFVIPVLAGALGGCAATPISKLAAEINDTRRRDVMVFTPGDELEIQFRDFPTWNHETRVLPDGVASYRAIDGVHTAGLTLDGLTAELNARYGRILNNPGLTVFPTKLAPRQVYVIGEVNTPGVIEIEGERGLTVVEAIARAGGPRLATSLLENVVLVRWDAVGQRQREWTFDVSQEQWGTPEPVFLQPYDLLFVPNKRIVRVNIWIEQYIIRNIPLPLRATAATGGL